MQDLPHHYHVTANAEAEGTDIDKAQRLMEKAEAACLVTNSLSAEAHLEAEVVVES